MAAPKEHVTFVNKLKYSRPDVESIRRITKETVKTEQLKRKERLITLKRLKVETIEDTSGLFSAQDISDKMKSALNQLKHGKKLEALVVLRGIFCKSQHAGEQFIRSDGLQSLMNCLASSNSGILHASAWCAINLCAGHSPSVLRTICLSPLLIQFLKGSDPVMQELCAWTLGNIAADSPANRSTLLQQGCVAGLLNMISTEHHLSFIPRTQSTLFALTNVAMGSLECIRSLQANSINNHIKLMMETFDVTSEVTSELGWLVNSIYCRSEVFAEYTFQYSGVLRLVIEKVSQITSLGDRTHKGKAVLPYLLCLGNILGLCSLLCVEASEDPSFVPAMWRALHTDTVSQKQDVLWTLANFFAEPSCCVFTMCQPTVLRLIFTLCRNENTKLALDALYLIEVTTHTSSHMCQHLLTEGTVDELCPLLHHLDITLTTKTLEIYMELLLITQQTEFFSGPILTQLQKLLTRKIPEVTSRRVQEILALC